MINRVFCYSKEAAKASGNKLPITALVLTTLLGMAAFIALPLMMDDFNAGLVIGVMIVWLAVLIYFSVILGLRLRSRMVGYATGADGKLYRAMIANQGQGLYFGGLAAGGLVDQLAGNSSSLGESIGGAVGAAAQFYTMKRAADYMSRPEIVAAMIAQAPNITGGEVFEILKVHAITPRAKSVKINCDYRILRNNKIKSQKNLTIERSYQDFDALMAEFQKH